MKNIGVILKKDFKHYFTSPIAYIYLITFLVFTNWFFFRLFFLENQVSMRALFDFIPWVFLFYIPAISMPTWSEEKKAGTLDLILTLPIRDFELILGKFLAGACLICLSILGTFPLVIIVNLLGDADNGVILASYLGAIFLGLGFLAFGLFISSLTKNQIIAFIISFIGIFLSIILANDFFLLPIPTFLVPILQVLSLANHYDSISRGILDFRDVLYLLSYIFFFLYLNWQVLNFRRL